MICPALNLESDSITRTPSLMLWLLIGVGAWQTQDFLPPLSFNGFRWAGEAPKSLKCTSKMPQKPPKDPFSRDGLSWKNNGCNGWNLLDLGIFRGAQKKTPGFGRPNSIHLKIYRSASLRHPMWCSILLPFMLFQIVSLLASSWARPKGLRFFFSGANVSGKCIVKPTGPMLCQYCWCINQGDWLYNYI